MGNGELVSIKINNWEKFNPRSDRGNFAWFRFQNSFFSDQVVFGLSSECKLLFIFLCCEASRHNSEAIKINPEYVSHLLKTRSSEIISNLNKLRSSGLVELLNGVEESLKLLVRCPRGEDRRGEDRTERTGENSVNGSAGADIRTQPEMLLDLWNENRGTLPKAVALSTKRTKHAEARLKENPDLNYWLQVIQRMAASNFCSGTKGWTATFDFFLKPDTHLKVIEGTYDNKQLPFKTFAEQRGDYNAEMHRKIVAGEI